MEKFVQLPFVIPHLDEDTVQSFAARRLQIAGRPNEVEPSFQPVEGAGEAPPEDAEEVVERIEKVERIDDLEQLSRDEGKAKRRPEERVAVAMAVTKKATELMSGPQSGEIRRIVDVAVENLDLNPRTIKRYFGAVRFLRTLQFAKFRTSDSHYDRMLVLRTAHLLMNRPEVVQWLQRQGEILNDDGRWVSAISGLEALVAEREDWAKWVEMWG